jgi:hypothetical protein
VYDGTLANVDFEIAADTILSLWFAVHIYCITLQTIHTVLWDTDRRKAAGTLMLFSPSLLHNMQVVAAKNTAPSLSSSSSSSSIIIIFFFNFWQYFK